MIVETLICTGAVSDLSLSSADVAEDRMISTRNHPFVWPLALKRF